MIISSRTPEGWPNHCPICHHSLRIEPSKPLGDAPCPYCGHLLWFEQSLPSVPRRKLVRRRARILVQNLSRQIAQSDCKSRTIRQITENYHRQLQEEMGRDLRESEKQAVLEQLKDELEIIGVTVAESDEPWWKFW